MSTERARGRGLVTVAMDKQKGISEHREGKGEGIGHSSNG